jgi:hypothetical protein
LLLKLLLDPLPPAAEEQISQNLLKAPDLLLNIAVHMALKMYSLAALQLNAQQYDGLWLICK